MTRKTGITKATLDAAERSARKAVKVVSKFTDDSFQNFAARVGISTDNLSAGNTYGFNPVTRIRTLLEWAYRGSWLVRVATDVIAEDMTRAGIELSGELQPDQRDQLIRAQVSFGLWRQLGETLKWSRLYGGAICVFLIDGQDPSQPLRLETIAPGQFKGLLVLDRWMIEPSLEDLVTDYGPDLGLPKYYRVTTDAPALRRMTIHHSRCIRLIGDDLPYWQMISENMWGASVLEAIWDRLTAFDSTTQGAAQLVYKAHLRTYTVDGLRDLIAAGGKMMEALVKQMQFVRLMQSNEGLSLVDGKDKFETHSYSFSGLSDVLLQLGQQLSGALRVPLTRLFGQSPAGLNSTGESDLRTYYDGINQRQETTLRRGVDTFNKLAAANEGFELPADFGFTFRSLWQLDETQKADVASKITETALKAGEAGIATPELIMKELKRQAPMTGVWSMITDEDIEAAAQMMGAAQPMTPEQLDLVAKGDIEGAMALGGAAGGNPLVKGGNPLVNGGKQDLGEEPDGTTEQPSAQAPNPLKRAVDRRRVQDHTQPPLMDVHGLPIVIETFRGEMRYGGSAEGRWQVEMPAHYGYIRGTSSAEGAHEQMDVFVCEEGDGCFIVDTLRPDTQQFDEHKVVLGLRDAEAVRALFRAAYHDNAEARVGAITKVGLRELKRWLRQGNVDLPYAWRPLRAVS